MHNRCGVQCDIFQAFSNAKLNLLPIHPFIRELTLSSPSCTTGQREYSINNYTKLYGYDTWQKHIALKNNIEYNASVLMTDDFPDEAGGHLEPFTLPCELYNIGKVCYSFVSYYPKEAMAV